MAQQLPAQEETRGTYREWEGVDLYISSRLRPSFPEDQVTAVWNNILAGTFPVTQGYMTGTERNFDEGRADIWTSHTVRRGERRQELKFLIVECKRPELATQPGIWIEAHTQLGEYLTGMARGTIANRVYGAIAIGKQVAFYNWTRQGGLENMADPTDYLARFNIEREQPGFTDSILDHQKAKGHPQVTKIDIEPANSGRFPTRYSNL
ncbi:MAG: hypothetical protein M1820_007410 [Bogoriella megaspora]|nr:MAG: hypothetical protein M1820_007410 [Bogoriella megaspora]